MVQHTQHWHVAVTCPNDRDGCQDKPFDQIDGALDYANERRHRFREEGRRVTEVDRPDDDAVGVIQRYEASQKQSLVATIEVRPCHHEACLSRCPPGSSPFRSAGNRQPWLQSHPGEELQAASQRAGRQPMTASFHLPRTAAPIGG